MDLQNVRKRSLYLMDTVNAKKYKTKSLPTVCLYVCLDLYNNPTTFDAVF
jgi:hypothetical protein